MAAPKRKWLIRLPTWRDVKANHEPKAAMDRGAKTRGKLLAVA
jgi:hypothetical protein